MSLRAWTGGARPATLSIVVSLTQPAPRRPTYRDIEALPDHVVGEILAGELVVSPRPAPRHTQAASTLGGLLVVQYHLGIGGPGGWWIEDEPELSLGVDPDYDPVIPDLAGWRFETMPELPETAQFEIVPDWVCEVVSPSSVRADRFLKLPFYARAGVGHAWLVDPAAELLEVYRLDGPTWRLASISAGATRVRAEPFDAVELDLGLLWRRTAPSASPA